MFVNVNADFNLKFVDMKSLGDNISRPCMRMDLWLLFLFHDDDGAKEYVVVVANARQSIVLPNLILGSELSQRGAIISGVH